MAKKIKNDSAITTYVSAEIRNKFNEMCSKKGLNASTVLRQFILETIN